MSSWLQTTNAKLIIYAYEYYVLNESTITDAQYDALYIKFKEQYDPKVHTHIKHPITKLVGAPSERLLIGAKLFIESSIKRIG